METTKIFAMYSLVFLSFWKWLPLQKKKKAFQDFIFQYGSLMQAECWEIQVCLNLHFKNLKEKLKSELLTWTEHQF